MPNKKPGKDAVRPAEQLLLELQVHQVELEQQNEELRRAQLRLDVSRARYFDLYDLAPIGYCTLSDRSIIVHANLTVVTMLGMARSTLMGRALSRFVHPDDQGVFDSLLRRAVDTGERQSAELRLFDGEGATLWANLVVTSGLTEDGKVERRVAISDVTQRREAELARREGETRYRDLFSRASDGILICSPSGVVFDVNEAFARMHGLTARDVATLNLRDLDVRSVALAPANVQRMAQGELLAFELEHRHRTGHMISVEASTSQVTIAGAPRVLAFYRDISERQRLRAGLAQRDRLASMGMLAAGVAHELNNPLLCVVSNLETLVEELPRVGLLNPESLDELVERTREALEGARRIKKIASGLGVFSRLEPVALESVDFNATLESAVNLARGELRSRAEVSCSWGHVPRVKGSEGKLAQVFLNVLINAAQAIGEGHAAQHRISIRTGSKGDEVFAEISDTGPGIPEENLARIFEPFFTTRVGVGTGLGLSLCRNIMTELGGDIQVTSVPGAPTCFRVRMPAGEVTPGPLGADVIPLRVQPPVRGRVLVIDDEEGRKALRRLLGRQHEVVIVSSGKQARALLEMDASFDVIICDLMMPELTGMELHAWLVSHAPALAPRVIFASGGALTPPSATFLATLTNPKLAKPFEAAEVKMLVERMVGR